MRPESSGGITDTSAGGFVNAARRAGGTEIVEGTVYARPDGRLRLDVRRVDLSTGAIGDVHTVEGNDLFALVDSGTARIVAALGTRAVLPAGSVADVTTRSVTAYRMYEQGIRAFFLGDARTASVFFEGATAEDSMFALATYYSALGWSRGRNPSPSASGAPNDLRRVPRIASASVLAGWAHAVLAHPAVADTLLTRYPRSRRILVYGIARVLGGEFLAAVAPLNASWPGFSGPRGVGSSVDRARRFAGFSAHGWRTRSSPRAAGRRWLRLRRCRAGDQRRPVFEAEGRAAAADSVFHSATPADPATTTSSFAPYLIRAGDYDTADALLSDKQPALLARWAYWQLASACVKGPTAEALDAARRMRPLQR
jgi:hypothetical protein